MDYSLYEVMNMPDPNFPIKVMKCTFDKQGQVFTHHWHEHLELLYFIKGKALAGCGLKSVEALAGDLVVINRSELHNCENLGDSLVYYCIISDIPILLGQFSDTCSAKYISPIARNHILFKNRINGDEKVRDCVLDIVREYEEKSTGYELEIKSCIFHLLVLLIRSYAEKSMSPREYDMRMKNMERFGALFKQIETGYNERITSRNCARMLSITESHFCHLFRQITGRTLSSYVNQVRIRKAETLLKDTSMSITEIALTVGFSDIAYFSRLFTQQVKATPTGYRRQSGCI